MTSTLDSLPLLIVEDDDVDFEALVRQLGRAELPVEIDHAADGSEALEKLRRIGDTPVVLLDWKLPNMNGEQFLEAVRADPALERTEVFVITASDSPEQIHSAFHHQVAGYVVKDPTGVGRPRLIEMLAAYVEVKQPPGSPAGE